MSEDDRLMVRLQSGDRNAFEELDDRYRRPLIGFFYRNTRDRELAEDLAQETMLRVYNQSWDYLPMGRFRAWMFRIGRNLLIDNVRRSSHDALVKAVRGSGHLNESDGLDRLIGDVLSPHELANHLELSVIVDEALDGLPEDQRLTFTLHNFAGLTLPEISEAMETSISTSKSRLRLAREKLREKLIRRGVPEPGQPSGTLPRRRQQRQKHGPLRDEHGETR